MPSAYCSKALVGRPMVWLPWLPAQAGRKMPSRADVCMSSSEMRILSSIFAQVRLGQVAHDLRESREPWVSEGWTPSRQAQRAPARLSMPQRHANCLPGGAANIATPAARAQKVFTVGLLLSTLCLGNAELKRLKF